MKPQQIKNRKFANLFWRQSVRIEQHSHHIFLMLHVSYKNLYKNMLKLLQIEVGGIFFTIEMKKKINYNYKKVTFHWLVLWLSLSITLKYCNMIRAREIIFFRQDIFVQQILFFHLNVLNALYRSRASSSKKGQTHL